MLSMTDYSGQGEALVGWLDSFWDSKGIITPEQFRCYSNDIVPLARFHKYTWQTDETFKAQIQVANYSDTTLITPTIWTLTDETGKLQQQGSREVPLSSGKVNQVDSLSVDLSEITSPGNITSMSPLAAHLITTVGVFGYILLITCHKPISSFTTNLIRLSLVPWNKERKYC